MIKYSIIFWLLILVSCSTYNNSNKKIEDIILQEYQNFSKIDTNMIKQEAKRWVISGSVLQQQKRYAESILDFWEALRYDSSASIYYAIAKSYLKLGRYEQAKQNIIKAIKINPDFIYAYQLLGKIFSDNYEYDKALSVYEKIVKLEPSYNNKMKLAKLYMLNYEEEKAIKLYNELLKLKNDPEILLRLASYYESIDNKLKANEYYEQLFNTIEKNIDTYELMIKNLTANNEYEKALNLLDSAKNSLVQNEFIFLFNYVGNKLLDDNDTIVYEVIPKYLSKIDQRFYFDWKINMIAGYLSFKVKDTVSTFKFFDRAVKADTMSQIPLSIAYFYYDNKIYDKAIETIQFTYPQHSTDYRFPLALGYFYYDIDKKKDALNYSLQAYKLDTNQIETMSHIGIIYDYLKKYDSCEYYYEKILQIDPQNALINNNYAYSLAVRGEKLDKALKMSEIAFKANPQNSSYLDTYGWILYKLGKYEEAKNYILKALKLDENNYEIYEHLGFVYLKLNDIEKAKKYFMKSLDINPNNDLILKELEKINK